MLTLYLTEETEADDVVAAYRKKIIKAVKLYPAGATTNSSNGVKNINGVYSVLGAMSEQGIPLLIHGEVTDPQIDILTERQVLLKNFSAFT